MKKRVIAVLTAVLMTASLAGCGSGKLSNDYVTVNKYKGLEVTEVAKNEVSDDSVEQEIQSRLEAAAPEQDVTDRAAQSGDWVNIDYKIYQKVTPELTDEWVANNSESSKTVDEYKEEVKNSLQEQQDDSGNSQLKQEVQTALLDQIEVNKYPDGAVDEQVKQANDYYTQIAQMYGVELSDFITTYLKMTEDQFNKKIEDSAKQAVQLEEAVKLIAKKEKLEPSDKEYKEGMQEYADKAGADLDTYKEQVGEDVLKDAILRDKVLDYLVDNCVQVEQSDNN